eukprot:TRINITY_DN9572_c0_g2_i1.p1 TRINITY_DN9572_c0_g2~~TRINITY_DN9572_c0_g2_i1.p1  ORF type:complete len:632 (+),score=107.79 TRINITY_DN9572_c0_g2_i1:49-1944(+)
MGSQSCRGVSRLLETEVANDVAADCKQVGFSLFGKEERPKKVPKIHKAPMMQAALRQGQGESSLSSCSTSSISSLSQELEPVSPASPGVESFWPEQTVSQKSNVNVLMEMARQISSGQRTEISKDSLAGFSEQVAEEFLRAVSNFSNGSNQSTMSTKKFIQRKLRRLHATTLFLISTMGSVPSASLKLVIDNPGKVHDYYNMSDKVLGKGGFGQVLSAKVPSTGAERAIKVVSKALMKEYMGALRDEIDVLKKVDHQNAVTLYEVFEDEANIFLVMELCSGGDLEEYVLKNRRLDEKAAAAAMQQLFRAVHHLHAKRICHRDLKCSNLLLVEHGTVIETEDNSVKVADYGLSTHFMPGKPMTQMAGTDTHMAPEVRRHSYTQACDLWSAGVCMYYLLSVNLPFTREQLETKTYTVRFSTAAWADVSQEAVELLGSSGLLSPASSKRPTAQAALRHKWIVNNCKAVSSVKVPTSVLLKLTRHRSQNRFKQACLSVVASFLSRKATAVERRHFFAMDARGNGLLPLADIYNRLRDEGEEVDMPLNANLSDISFMEFIAATFDRKRCLNQKLCKLAFSVFDRNGDGNISISEIIGGRVLGTLSADEVFQTLDDLDKNGDSQIDFKEFTDMLRSE